MPNTNQRKDLLWNTLFPAKGIYENMFGNQNLPDPMEFDTAYTQAEKRLQPKFNQEMNSLQSNLVNRGFYGQMPGDVMQQQLQTQQTGQTADLANKLQQRDWERNTLRYKLEQQQNQQQSQGIGNILGTILKAALL